MTKKLPTESPSPKRGVEGLGLGMQSGPESSEALGGRASLRSGMVDPVGKFSECSRYENNIFLQPDLIQKVLEAPRPKWMDELKSRRVFFVGIGTSFHAAQISKWLWREYVSAEAEAVHSFDFVRMPQPVKNKDVVVLFSHSGAKSFTVEAAALAQRLGAVTVGITQEDGPWKDSLSYRLETCRREDTGVHTKSLTTALAWIARWIEDPTLRDGITEACARLPNGPDFPVVSGRTDLVLIGGLAGEWVAREIALKTQEAAYLPARPFGIEEFLHGPRVSVGEDSSVIGFINPEEKRWDSIRDYLKTIEVPLLEIRPDAFKISKNAGWLWQLFWGQRFTLEICRKTGINPDAMRTQDSKYKLAREKLAL